MNVTITYKLMFQRNPITYLTAMTQDDTFGSSGLCAYLWKTAQILTATIAIHSYENILPYQYT